MDGTEKSVDPSESQIQASKLHSSKDEPFANANNTDENTRLALSTWMEHSKSSAPDQLDKNEMSESHPRLSMESNTTRSATLNPVTGVGVCGEICEEEEEEDTSNFVSTLDVDAIKRSPASSTMQIPSYPPPVPSVSGLRSVNQRTSSSVSHRAVENNSIQSSNQRSSLLPSSNNKAPLITIPENWATLDTVPPRLQPMTLTADSKIRPNINSSHFPSLPNQSFHAIRSHYGRSDSSNSGQSTQLSTKNARSISSSSSSKSHRRHHHTERRQQGREDNKTSNSHYTQNTNSLQQQRLGAQRLTESGTTTTDSIKQSHCDESNNISTKEEECHSDQGSEDSDSDSSDSSDCSESRSHSDTESRHGGNVSSDDEDSGSNASRSGSSSSYSSDGEDDSSSSSCCSSQSCTKRKPIQGKEDNLDAVGSEHVPSHRKSSVIRSKVSNVVNQINSDINESSSNRNTSSCDMEMQDENTNHHDQQHVTTSYDQTHQKSMQVCPDSQSTDTQTASLRDNKDLLGVNMYTISPPTSADPSNSSCFSSSNICSGGISDRLSHQVTGNSLNPSIEYSKLTRNSVIPSDVDGKFQASLASGNTSHLSTTTGSSPTSASSHSTINVSQADNSLGYSACYSTSSPGSSETLSSSKDNFPKPFPPKPEIRKSDVIRGPISSRLSGGRISDNNSLKNSESSNSVINNVAPNVMNLGRNNPSAQSSINVEHSSLPRPLNSNNISRKNEEAKEDSASKKILKSDKKLPHEKVCPSPSVFRHQLHNTNQSNDCDNAAAISTSRSSADTIDQHSTGDNKSNVDGETGGSDATTTSTAEIAHFAEQLDSISDDEEGGEGGGETLNSITGGLQVIEDADLVAILKDVSTCGTESPTTVGFINTLQGASDAHHDDGSHQKSDHHRRQPHSHSSSSSSSRTLPAPSTMANIQDSQSMQTANTDIVPSSSGNQPTHCNNSSTSSSPPTADRNESLTRKYVTEAVNSDRKQQTYDHSVSSVQMQQIPSSRRLTEHSTNVQTSEKTRNFNSTNQKTTKQLISFDGASLIPRTVSVTNVCSSSVKYGSSHTTGLVLDNNRLSTAHSSTGTTSSLKAEHHSQEHKTKHHNTKKRRSRNTTRGSKLGGGNGLLPLQPYSLSNTSSCSQLQKQASTNRNTSSMSQQQTLLPHNNRGSSNTEVAPHEGITSSGVSNVTTIVQQTQNTALQNATVQVYHQQQVQDIDLYLNSSTSNVSPDSGIQSEGGGGMANSSPLHLTDTASTTSSLNNQSLNVQSHGQQQHQTILQNQQQTISHFQHQAPSPNLQGSSQSPSTQHQTLQQFTNVSPQGILSSSIQQRTGGNWTPNTGVSLPATLSPLQHSPGAFYGSYVQPSPNAASGPSPSPPAGSAQFSTMVATQTAYVYHSPGSSHAPLLLGNLTSVSSNPASQTLRVPVQQNQQSLSHIGNSETPPPTLLPAMSSIHLSPVSMKSQTIYSQLKPKCPSSSSSSSAGSGNESNTKRGRGRPKGSKNKIRKKVTMTECASQTVESSLDRVMYASRTTSPPDDSDEDDSDSASDCASTDLPPPPVFMGPATNSEPLKASRGRPRKDPPMLIPQVAKPILNTSPSEKPKHILLHLDKEVPISRVRTISKTPLKGAKSCEVILLESDDSTVFSDEDDADEDEDDAPSISHPPKLPLPLPPMIQKNSSVQKSHISTNKLSQQPMATNLYTKHRQTQDQLQVKPKDPYTLNVNKKEANIHIAKRSSSPYSEPPVLKVESRSDLLEVSDCLAPPHPPSLPLQRNESTHSSRRSEKKKKKKKKKSKSKSKHRHKNDEERHRSKSPHERDSSYSPIRNKSSSVSNKRPKHAENVLSKSSKSKITSTTDGKKAKKIRLGDKKSCEKNNAKEKNIKFQSVTSRESVPFSFLAGEKVPKVFDEKYCNLRPQQFWKGTNLADTNSSLIKNDTLQATQNDAKVSKKSKVKNDSKILKEGKVNDGNEVSELSKEDENRQTGGMDRYKGNCRVLTKASLKEICSSTPNQSRVPSMPSSAAPPNGGLPTKTLLNILASTNKQKSKPGRKKKRGLTSEWSESITEIAKENKGTKHSFLGSIIDQDESPCSSIHSNKSPFSPRSSIGSASIGSDHGQVGNAASSTAEAKYGSMLDCSEGYKTFKPKGKKKQKKDKRTDVVVGVSGGWKTKHKNVIDPVFLGEVEYLIQDVASCQLELSQVSRDYWPDRPLDSVPSIFRRQKISATRAKRLFAELIEAGRLPHLPIIAPQKHSMTSARAVSTTKDKPKRGRPKKNSQDGAQSSSASGTKSATDSGTGHQQSGRKAQSANNVSTTSEDGNSTAAEQRLPLKKRHRHNIPTKGGGGNGNSGNVEAVTVDSESGNSSSGCALSPPIMNIMPQTVSSRRYSTAKVNRDNSASSSSDIKTKMKEENENVQKGRNYRKSSTDRKVEESTQSVSNKKQSETTEKIGGRRSSSTQEKSNTTVKIKLGKASVSFSSSKCSNPVAPSYTSSSELKKDAKICSIEPTRKDGQSLRDTQYEKRYQKIRNSTVADNSLSGNKPLIPNNSSANPPIKSLNIVDSLASCIDKYTGSKSSAAVDNATSSSTVQSSSHISTVPHASQPPLSKQQQQTSNVVYNLKDSKHGNNDFQTNVTRPLTVKTSLPKCSVPTNRNITSSDAFDLLENGAPTSPRKRHLLQMKQNENLDAAPDLKPSFVEQPSRETRTELAPPLLEKISLPNSRSFGKKVCAVTPTVVSNPRSLIEKHRQHRSRMEMCKDQFSTIPSCSKSLSPPRLSPPRLSPPHTSDILSIDKSSSSTSPHYSSHSLCRNSFISPPLASPSSVSSQDRENQVSSRLESSQAKYKPNYSDISDDENAATAGNTVMPLTIKIKPPPIIPKVAMPMNTSKDAEEAFDRLTKEDDKLQNDPKRLQKEVSRRLLQRNETAADRILQKQYKQLQQDQEEAKVKIDRNESVLKDRDGNTLSIATTCAKRKASTEEELEFSSSVDGKEESSLEDSGKIKDNEKFHNQSESLVLSNTANNSKLSSTSSSVSPPEDASVSLPSDSCDYMELECEIEPYDDDSLTPTPPEISTDHTKTTAIVAPNIKKEKSVNEKRKEPTKNKIPRKQQQRRVLTIRVKKLKERDSEEGNENVSKSENKTDNVHSIAGQDNPIASNKEKKKIRKSESGLKNKKVKAEKISLDATAATTANPTKARKRKRKANKTGFPSVKKKKKKQNPFVDSDKSSSRSSSTPRTSRPSSVAEVRESKKAPAAPVRASSRVQALEEAKQLTEKEDVSIEVSNETVPSTEHKNDLEKEEELMVKPSEKQTENDPVPSIEIAKESNSEEIADKSDNGNIKKPRGRPPKKKQSVEACNIDNEELKSVSIVENKTSKSDQPEPLSSPGVIASDKRPREESEESQRSIKRSRLYTDEIDEEIDCLSLLPTTGMESGLSSEAPSMAGSETEGDSKSTCSSSTNTKKKKKKNILSKKKSLVAGLFSDYYKTSPQENNSSPSVNRRWAYNVEEHVHGLLPPPYYCGRQLRQKKEDYQLPYDLWWLHANKQLPGRDVVATWNYKRIKNNVYFDIKPIAKDLEGHACQCDAFDPSPQKCGEDCINRMTYTECDPKLCPSGDRCMNNSIQKHKTAPGLERFMTKEKGWGIRTKHSIGSSVFIMEYVGEVVSEKEFKLRMLHEYADDNHHYCMHMDSSMVIDGHRMGGECRFVNHSCNPNCEMQKWSVNGLYRMALFSLEDIKSNEELTYDYNFSLFNPHEGQVCRCGAKDCRGVIGGRTQRVNGPSSSLNGTSLDVTLKDTGSEDKKDERKGKAKRSERSSSSSNQISRLLLLAPIKPLSEEEIMSVRKYRCFLFRNFEKVRKLRDYLQQKMSGQLNNKSCSGNNNNNNKEEVIPKSEEMILTGLTALTTARSMQTRRLAIAQDDPKVTKVVKLAQVLREIFAQVTTQNDENGKAVSKSLQNLPSKKKQPQYYDIIPEPIDLQTIDRFINTGSYTQPDQFDRDILRSLQNALRFYGQFSAEGAAALKLRKVYNSIKREYVDALSEIVGETEKGSILAYRSTIFKAEEEEGEDRIECLCGQYKDEGLMIQCEKCQVWQHCDCVGQTGEDEESYLCPKCGDREALLDIPLVPQPDYASPGEKYFVSISRCENLQVRVGDTVYVLRAKNKNDDVGTNSNEGLLKIAPMQTKQKKRAHEKKKDKSESQKIKVGEENANKNQSEPEKCEKFTNDQGLNVDTTCVESDMKGVSESIEIPKVSNDDDAHSCKEVQKSNDKEGEGNSSETKETSSENISIEAASVSEMTKLERDASVSNSVDSGDSTNCSDLNKKKQGEEIASGSTNEVEGNQSVVKCQNNLEIDVGERSLPPIQIPSETTTGLKIEPVEENNHPPPMLTPPRVEVDATPSTDEDTSSNIEQEKKKTKDKDQFCHGGITHKMMSPTKGPALEASSLAKGNYPTYKGVDTNTISIDDMDIFRIERLWVNESGQRFAFGHHYLRPRETFHEKSRRFFPNEVFRVPIYEVLPLDTVWRQCWVLDLQTYCKGRPAKAKEEHVYICENRVDKHARIFQKISKPKYPICMKWFAFNVFDLRLRPQRTYTPHEITDNYSKKTSSATSSSKGRAQEDEKPQTTSNKFDSMTPTSSSSNSKQGVTKKSSSNLPNNTKGKTKSTANQQQEQQQQNVSSSSSGNKNKNKLEDTLLKLLSKMPKKNAVDASYLLETDKRSRKRKIW